MQKNIFWIILTGLIITACGDAKKDANGDLSDKKAKLQELKGEQRKLADEITKLEGELAKLDTGVAAQGKPKLVALEPVGSSNFTHFVDLQGKIDATNISYVAPPNGQGGVVTALYVRQGDYVRKGQTLARLDDQLIRQQIEPLRVQLTAAEDTYRRTQNLWNQGIGTYQQVLTAKTQTETLRRQIALIQKQASLMVVTAPNAGVVDELNLRVGEILSPAQNPQMPQIKIVNTGSLKIVADVPENYLGKIGVGTNIKVQLPQAGNRIIDTKVRVAGKLIDPRTRSFYIEAPIPSDPDFKPNQIAIVKVQDYATANAITIPLNTLQNDETGKFVMVAVKEGSKLVARKRKVVTGELYDDRLEVKSGLQNGDMLVKEGFQSLYEGQLLMTENGAK